MSIYKIGTLGKEWSTEDKFEWLKEQKIQRSYYADVLSKINLLKNTLDVIQYGSLNYSPNIYSLFIIQTKNIDISKKTILITGGVHGYETSGVHGALKFLEKDIYMYTDKFNILVAPCVSPWGYETINRWNPNTIDPNRSFIDRGLCDEASLLMSYISSLDIKIHCHIDLHETTDTDNTEFMPALASKDNKKCEIWDVPDGFYLVADAQNIQPEFQKSIIESVAQVTHIAPADKNNKIIMCPVIQEGVISYNSRSLGLCAGFSKVEYSTTTEVYPDSIKTTSVECISAQLYAINGALGYLDY